MATFIYVMIFVTLTAVLAYYLGYWFDWSLYVTVPLVGVLISPWLTLCIAFLIWPIMGMFLGILGLDNEEEQDIPESGGHNYVIDTKTGEQIHSDKKH